MTKRPSPLRRMALALMQHAARTLPTARGPWAKAMQHELPQIESDREALRWAGGCLVAACVERGRAMARRWLKTGLPALCLAVISVDSWWAGQRPHLTPGDHQVFHEGSTTAALIGFGLFWLAAAVGLHLLLALNDRKLREVGAVCRIGAAVVVFYIGALVTVSLLTPRTIVNIGDSYCYDLWCLGVNQVNAALEGQNILYTADVRVFVDSTHAHQFPAAEAKGFFYVLDDRGRRYPLLQKASFVDIDRTFHPGETVKSTFAFRAPRNAQKLYLAGNDDGELHLPWVYLYFGSDVSLFHRPALLRIL